MGRRVLDRLFSIRLSSDRGVSGLRLPNDSPCPCEPYSKPCNNPTVTFTIPLCLLIDALGDGIDLVELIGLLRRGAWLQSSFRA